MGVGAWYAGAKLTFLSWLSPTSGAPPLEYLLLGDFHGYIVRVLLSRTLVILDQFMFYCP